MKTIWLGKVTVVAMIPLLVAACSSTAQKPHAAQTTASDASVSASASINSARIASCEALVKALTGAGFTRTSNVLLDCQKSNGTKVVYNSASGKYNGFTIFVTAANGITGVYTAKPCSTNVQFDDGKWNLQVALEQANQHMMAMCAENQSA